ncbi:CgeB family protein [Gimesia sp.]|uniref:CgeB family protein n=1 Tax=Gimesia sp. TaxID=2024833 RepID=UPI003A8CB345
MVDNKKILISGASYDGPNRNAILRTYVLEGFQELLGEDSAHEIALDFVEEGLRKYQPDILLLFGSCMPDDISYNALKKYCDKHNILLVFWLHDDPYEFDYGFKVENVADVIFSNDKWASLHYSHDHAYHLPLAASKRTHFQNLNSEYDHDIFFCGVAFHNRIQLVRDLQKVLEKHKTLILGAEWPDDIGDFLENRTIRNDQLIDYYGKSKVILNMGRHFNYANKKYSLTPSTPGPRTFEAAMAGAVQFYFAESLEILDYYSDGTEIILFDSVHDFAKKIEMLLDDTKSLQSIGTAAQQKTLAAHTYTHRASQIMETLSQYF